MMSPTDHVIAAIFLAGVFLAGLDTASNSLVVAMLGPQRAPPFTQVNKLIIKYYYINKSLMHSHCMLWLALALSSAPCWSDPSSLTPGDIK